MTLAPRTIVRTAARMAPVLLLLAACATAGPEPDSALAPGEPRAAALRLSVTGATAVLDTTAPISVELVRAGAEEPVTLAFTDGDLAMHELPPGRYAVTRIGGLSCTGLDFELAPGAAPRALGTLRAEIIRTDYDVALVSGSPATPADLAQLGGTAESDPLAVHRQALCHSSRDGDGTQFHDMSPAEQVMTVILFGGFCAAALASGGFCAF
jgi:hypothetical protein